MKKTIALILVLACAMGLLGCGSQPPPAEPNAMIPTVQINGVHYLTTGEQSAVVERKDGFDGRITSTVKGSELPAENDQSNFGEGYGYQFGTTEGTVDVYIDGNWWLYATEEVRDQIQHPEWHITLENPPALIVTLDDKSIDAKQGTMDWHSRVDDAMDSLMSADSAQGAEGSVPVLRLAEDDGLEVSLFWEVTPDRVYLRYWSETDTDGEFVPVKTSNEVGDCYLTDLQDGNYSYEVLARWENAETYGGECCYQFRVEK